MANKEKLTVSIGYSKAQRDRCKQGLARLATASGCLSISELVERLGNLNRDDRLETGEFLRAKFANPTNTVDTQD